MDLGVLLESPQGSQSSSRVGTCTCAFLSSCISSVTLPFTWIKGSVAFTRGFPTGLSHVPPWCESILGLKVEAVQGNQVSLEWTETSGGLWEWWHEPGVPLAFPVESLAHIQRSPFPPHSSRGRILSLRYLERIPGVPLASQEEPQPQERREELQGLATISRVPQMSQSIPGKTVFPVLPRLSSRG